MAARTLVLALLNEIGKRLIDKRLKLPPFCLGKTPHGREEFGVDLGREFLTDFLGHGAPSFLQHDVMICHDKSSFTLMVNLTPWPDPE
jgi:hypothetical protein